MSEPAIMCPYCGGAVPQDTTVCPDCHEDLSALIQLEHAHGVYYNQALALAREGRLEEARARVLLALEHSGTFVPAHTLLAKIYARQGAWDRAQGAARRALELAPSDPRAAQVAQEIAEARAESEALRRRELRVAALRTDPNSAVHQLSVYRRDVRVAFGLGLGLAAFAAMVISWLNGGRGRG